MLIVICYLLLGKNIKEHIMAEIRSSQDEMKNLLDHKFISIHQHLKTQSHDPLSVLKTQIKAIASSLTSLRENLGHGFEMQQVLVGKQQMNRD